MNKSIYFISTIILALTACSFTYAETTDNAVFQQLFDRWTNAFNHKSLAGACALFSKQVTADYRGTATKNYRSLCDGFKRVFNDTNRTYHYSFKLHQVYHEKNLAAARITWYLQVTEHGKPLPVVQDEGLDVLMKDRDQRWKIVNYIGYEVAKSTLK